MNTYTVFCQEADGHGTIWISAIVAESYPDAMDIAQHQCADDWNMDEADIHVLGVAEGDIKILHWVDLEGTR